MTNLTTSLTEEKLLESRDRIPSVYHSIFCNPAIEETMQEIINQIQNERDDIPSFLGMKVIVRNSMPRNIIMMVGEGKGNYQFIRLVDEEESK